LTRTAEHRTAEHRTAEHRTAEHRTAEHRTAVVRPNERTGAIVPHLALPCRDPAALERLKASTPAKVGVGRAGLRYRTQTLLQFQVDFAVAKAAVESQIPISWPEEQGLLPMRSAAADPEQFLARPDLGRRLSEESQLLLRDRCAREPEVQIVVGDGLSASAVIQNAPPMLATLLEELERRGRRVGTSIFVRHCRAKIVDVVGQALGARVGIILLGERPGLGTGDGMSAYLVWQPAEERTDAEKQAISNIHSRGLAPADAGRHAANVIEAILTQRTSGVGLDLKDVAMPPRPRQRINQAHAEPLQGCGQSHGQRCEASAIGRPGAVCCRDEGRPCEAGSH
jgi:ethanolamine ammonia-lyase small subunit